ncbi:PREDICTED: glutamate receptor ionotropic, kainate 2-like [Nicrophorus vespilloides]|uniref:Glutamate receptor ionotropic, kainate 2-like n=1 Tax=Nicrophorus vespilloides TaxID=110193 RepID=A0ABM1MH75_NICVS|nr:PREDICTED: glutamate receptor ionotropic, kainate 2-like [Nicrophorus vespilloides]
MAMDTWRIRIIFFVACFDLCWTQHLTIGALFSGNEQETELAFKYAVQRYNMVNTGIKFKTNIQRIVSDDPFATSKIVCNMTADGDGVVAIFGPSSSKVGPMVQSICSTLEIPQVQISWNPSTPFNHQPILNIHPDQDLLSCGIATVVKHLDWSSYAIIYQTNEGLVRLQEILKLVNVDDEPVMVRQLGEGNDHRSVLKEIKNTTISQIILDCETEDIIDILRQAKEVNLLDVFHSILLTSLDAHTLDFNILETNANITVVRIVNPQSQVLENSILDWKQGEMYHQRYHEISADKIKTETALMNDAIYFFLSALKELHESEPIATKPLLCDGSSKKWEDGFRVSKFLKIKYMEDGITGPIKFSDEGKRVDFTMQVAEIINGRVEKTAYWYPSKPDELSFTRNASQLMQQIVENLQKTTVIVSSRIGPPYLRNAEARQGEVLMGNDRYEGFSMDLIASIAKELNFTFRFELTEDHKYGNYDPKTKSWNGLIKDLLDRKAHLAICDLTITHERREVVDFSMPFMTLGVSILYSKGKQQDENKFAFMDPFDLEVWVYTSTLYLGLSILLYFIARMAPGDWENPHPCNQNPGELENIWNLKNCTWITLGSIMTQGCDILPKGISTRMGVSMWWFFSLIMTSSYTANLAAFLTMDRMAPTIDSADALVKQTKIKYGTVEGGSTQTFFRESNFSTYQRMWTQMSSTRPSVFEKNNGEGVKRVLTTKNQLYAFLMESSSIEYEVEKNCNLKQVGNRLDSKGYGIAMPMNSPYRSAINKAVLKLQEEGTLNELKNRWWKKKVPVEVPCDKNIKSSGADLALDNVGGVFIVLGIGICIAFGFAFLEFLWNVRKVALQEHIGYWDAFVVECKFAVRVWVTKKQVKPDLSSDSDSSRDNSESKTVAHKVLKGAGSFLHLDDFEISMF